MYYNLRRFLKNSFDPLVKINEQNDIPRTIIKRKHIYNIPQNLSGVFYLAWFGFQ